MKPPVSGMPASDSRQVVSTRAAERVAVAEATPGAESPAGSPWPSLSEAMTAKVPRLAAAVDGQVEDHGTVTARRSPAEQSDQQVAHVHHRGVGEQALEILLGQGADSCRPAW